MDTNLRPKVNNTDHIQGNENAKLELVEFGDYQCSHCGEAYPIIKAVQEIIGERMKFIFRNFPLGQIHRYAVDAAIATEAAALQGMFWEMHDIIYENQIRLEPEELFLYARMLGLDLARFREDVESIDVVTKIEKDIESGASSGVKGTPSFFINGEKFNGDWRDKHMLLDYLLDL